MTNDNPKFEVVVLGIIFDPKSKKVLIGRRENDPHIDILGWCFPGGRLGEGEEIDDALKKKMKLKTGYDVKNVGTFFSQTYDEKPGMVSIAFLTSVYDGEEKPGDDFVELKWIHPKEVDQYFNIQPHKKLRDFLNELV